MSLFKKSDVKNHLSGRRHSGIHIAPEIPADAKALPADDQTVDKASATGFAKDFIGDHTTARPVDGSIGHNKPQESAATGAAKM